jgi:hypothetical protein
MSDVSDYLDLYEKNNIRKGLSLHREMEHHFLQPLAMRLERKLVGPAYRSFVEAKSRAVSAFDTATRASDSFMSELPPIPNIRVCVSGLSDPVVKYRVHAAREQRLAQVIAESQGIQPKPPSFIERDTMNLRKWSILAETRFYDGAPGAPKGKRIHPGGFRSTVGEALDAFAPPEPRVVRQSNTSYGPMQEHIWFGQEGKD